MQIILLHAAFFGLTGVPYICQLAKMYAETAQVCPAWALHDQDTPLTQPAVLGSHVKQKVPKLPD